MSKSILAAALLAGAGLSLSAVGAQAQDWSGFYVGLSAGGATGTNQIEGEFEDFFDQEISSTAGRTEIPLVDGMIDQGVDIDGGTFGAQVGYLFQTGTMIYGGELSYRTANVSYSGFIGEGPRSLVDIDLEVQNMTSLRGILGTSVGPRTMVFTSLGFVTAQTETTFEFDNRARREAPAARERDGVVVDDNTRTGFAIGFGLSQALSDRLFLTGEYTYTDLGTARYDGGREGAGFLEVEQDISFSALTIGLNLRF